MPPYYEIFRPTNFVVIDADVGIDTVLMTPEGVAGPDFKLDEEQREYLGKEAIVRRVSYYHFGFVLYELEDLAGSQLPGMWAEGNLLDRRLVYPYSWWGWPNTMDYYSIDISADDDNLIEIRDPQSVLCAAFREHCTAKTIEAVREVARALHMFNFEIRYGFYGTFDRDRELKVVEICSSLSLRVISITSSESELTVSAVDQENVGLTIAICGVARIDAERPEGMEVFMIIKCESDCDEAPYRYRFVNTNGLDSARLDVIAHELKVHK